LLRRISLEFRRRDELDHLQVLRVAQLAVADARRLVEAGAGLHRDAADAFVLEHRRALQHVDELHVDVVPVPFAVRRLLRPGADDMRHHLSPRGALDPQVAIFEVAAQAAAAEFRAF
jgi:hypothetical protein